jgi:hypothetical protein
MSLAFSRWIVTVTHIRHVEPLRVSVHVAATLSCG